MSAESAWRRKLLALASNYNFIIFYALSVALGRGLSIFILPLTSRFIPPGDYARLDVAASIIEICGLIATFALGDLVFRFAGSAKTDLEQKRVASEILGVGLVCAAITALASQLLLPAFAGMLSIGVSDLALRAGLLAATFAGLVELPMAWLRLRNRPAAYLGFVAVRSIAQITLMIAVLMQGFGPEGVIVSNACVEGVLTAYLVYRQIKEFGVSFSREMGRHALHYSTPIVIGSLAMFGLGSCDRFFLAGAVPAAALAQYTLAGKLAFATPLLLQPFALWWNARRILVLQEAGGLERSSRIAGYGFLVLVLSGALTIFAGTLFVEYALPRSYHEAIHYLPLMVLIAGFNEVATLVNVGSFARPHGREVLYVNGAGGIVAVLGYLALVPLLGIDGAIVATLLGQALRIALFLWLGRHNAPIAYPMVCVFVMAVSLAGIVWLRPADAGVVLQLAIAAFGLLVIMVEAAIFRLLPWPRPRSRIVSLPG